MSDTAPRLLDLFCGAGGSARGYMDAGFYVVGVDTAEQPNYCGDEFIQADAQEFLHPWQRRLDFDAIHASPPCQFATAYKRTGNVKPSPNLIEPTRRLLQGSGLPYVIENIELARPFLRDPLLLCGSMFDMDIQRHRLFETSWPARSHHWPCRHRIWANDRFPGGRSKERTGSSRGLVRRTVEIGSWDIPIDVQRKAMEISWMQLEELSEAIPPRYTAFLGEQLLAHVRERIAA